jgi:hypothetical protein
MSSAGVQQSSAVFSRLMGFNENNIPIPPPETPPPPPAPAPAPPPTPAPSSSAASMSPTPPVIYYEHDGSPVQLNFDVNTREVIEEISTGKYAVVRYTGINSSAGTREVLRQVFRTPDEAMRAELKRLYILGEVRHRVFRTPEEAERARDIEINRRHKLEKLKTKLDKSKSSRRLRSRRRRTNRRNTRRGRY